MAAFKEMFSVELIEWTGHHIKKAYQAFDKEQFIETASCDLNSLELKERAAHITKALTIFLPDDFYEASEVVHKSLHPTQDSDRDKALLQDGITGWAVWPLCDWATQEGMRQPDIALNLLKCLTKRFSAEFAIRPFLDEQTDATMLVMHKWVGHKNRHVRRLVSEGTRPRLPWGMQLKSFVKDPTPILPLLHQLRDDEDEYVRRSVANNLNDISKDHPDLVASIAADWLQGASKDRRRLVKHACRSLIKQGHVPTLKAFGYQEIEDFEAVLHIMTSTVNYGDALEFDCEFTHQGDTDAAAIIDYAIHFVKANGKQAAKVFKWKTGKLKSGRSTSSRRHVIKPITTRKYYGGQHKLDIIVNGRTVASGVFDLVM